MLLQNQRLKHIAQASAHAEKLPLLEVGNHIPVVGALFHERLIQLPVELRRGDGEVRLADHIEHLRRFRQTGQKLSPSLHQRRAAQNAERHVASDLRAELAERGNGQRRAGELIERLQYRRSVRAAAAQARAERNAFADENLQAVRLPAGSGEKGLRRLPGKILFVLRKAVGQKLGLLVCITVVPFIFMFVSYILYKKHYKLDEDEYTRICGELQARRG